MTTPIMTVVIVDDDTMLLETFCEYCKRLGHQVVGVASTCAAGRKLILQEQPDLVILDIGLPGAVGLNLISELREAGCTSKFLTVSGLCDTSTIMVVAAAKPEGFIYKLACKQPHLAAAFEALQQSNPYFSPEFLALQATQKIDSNFCLKKLSNRELQTVSLVGGACETEEIAEILGTSSRTAETHRSRVLNKLGLHSSTKLMAFSIHHGFNRIYSFLCSQKEAKAKSKKKQK